MAGFLMTNTMANNQHHFVVVLRMEDNYLWSVFFYSIYQEIEKENNCVALLCIIDLYNYF